MSALSPLQNTGGLPPVPEPVAVPRGAVLRARFDYWLRQLGPVGWIGLILIVLALALLATTLHFADLTRATEADQQVLRDRLARAPAAGTVTIDDGDPIGTVVAQLPPAATLAPFLADVQTLAATRGVRIDRTEYRVVSALQGKASRYQLVLPARGSYTQIRGWLDALLQAHPTAALDDLQMLRADGGNAIEARITLVYYLRSSP